MSDGKRTVLITGSAGGLGRELVRRFLAEGWTVAAASRTPTAGTGPETVGPVTEISMDVTDSAQVDAAVDHVLDTHGRIDCLVHNAGITSDALCWQLREEEWDQVLDVNLNGAFRCARAVARSMARQRDGHIINISSFAGRAGAAGQANYAAAKAGLFALTQSLARELGSRGVRANAVLPGVLPTRMTEALTPEQMNEFACANALGRINSLEEVARFIVFLAATQNISGQFFQLDSRITPWA